MAPMQIGAVLFCAFCANREAVTVNRLGLYGSNKLLGYQGCTA
jgi:hypothetical protein